MKMIASPYIKEVKIKYSKIDEKGRQQYLCPTGELICTNGDKIILKIPIRREFFDPILLDEELRLDQLLQSVM